MSQDQPQQGEPVEPVPAPATPQGDPAQYPQPGGYAQPGQYAQPYPGQPQYSYPAPAPRPLSQQDERTWAMMSYLLAIIGGFLAPLIILLVLKDRSAFVRDVAKESLNFQITLAIATFTALIAAVVVAVVVSIASSAAAGIVFLIVWLAIILIGILSLVVDVVGAVKANGGEVWRIPGILRFVK